VDNPEELDQPRPFTAVEFCAGYAGIHLGLDRAIRDLRLLALCEIEAFATANLVAKMEAGLLDAAPVWTDLKTFPAKEFHGKVDLLVAGYPCQPFSAAGKRAGTDDPRHLWPFIRETVRAMRPTFCFFENVEGHISLGLSTVLSDLEEDGYRTTWGVFSAAEVGAPHQRKRVFILAHDESWESREQKTGYGGENSRRGSQELAYNLGQRVKELGDGQPSGAQLATAGNSGAFAWPSRPGEDQHEWEPPRVTRGLDDAQSISYLRVEGDSRQTNGPVEGRGATDRWDEDGGESSRGKTQPPMGRDSDGPAGWLDDAELYCSSDNRVDELRLLGNGVVPATAERAWRTLYARLVDA